MSADPPRGRGQSQIVVQGSGSRRLCPSEKAMLPPALRRVCCHVDLRRRIRSVAAPKANIPSEAGSGTITSNP